MTIDPNLVVKALDSKVAEKTYNDGLSAPIKEFSKFVTDIIKTARLLCFPVQMAASYQERLEKRLAKVIQQVPEENIIVPPNSLLVPIVNCLNYIEDGNILIEIFQNLLARAMDKTRNSEAHPAFITSINQLSPDEAILLYEIKFKKIKFTRLYDLDKQRNKFYNQKMESNTFPVEKLIFGNNFDMYIGHLEKLDLICVHDKDNQAIFKDDNSREQVASRETYTMGFTRFGDLFSKACLPDLPVS